MLDSKEGSWDEDRAARRPWKHAGGGGQVEAPPVTDYGSNLDRLEDEGLIAGPQPGLQDRGISDSLLGSMLDNPCGPTLDAPGADAAEELEPLFDIVTPFYNGPRLPNQVEPEEFDRVVEIYGAIREGGGCMDISPLEEEQQGIAMKQIAKILQTGVGRALLGGILENSNGKKLTWGELSKRPSNQILDPPAAEGTVPGGSDSRVLLDASKPHERSGDPLPWYPVPPDVALFHELVHGHGALTGSWLREKDEEEARATGIATDDYDYRGQYLSENAYRAERRLLGEDLPYRERY